MTISNEKILLDSTEFKREGNEIKHYIQSRFKDIISIIKAHPILSCISPIVGSCRVLAVSIYSVTLPIFVFLTFLRRMVLDYLNKDYCYQKHFSSSSLTKLFLKLQLMPLSYGPLPSEALPYLLKEDAETVKFIEKQDQKKLKERERYKEYENDDRPVFLFIKAKSDHNAAFNDFSIDNLITINGDNNNGVKELKKKYKIVLINNTSNADEIKNKLGEIKNIIQHVLIIAHGRPTEMHLDSNNSLKNHNLDDLSNLMQQKLAGDAHVALCSCSTGKNVFPDENIAKKFSKILPGRNIWAPKLIIHGVSLELEKNSSIKVNFWKYKSRLEFLKEKIWNVCCLQPFKEVEAKLDVTTRLKNGIEIE